MALISAEHLTKRFGAVTAVEDLTVEIEAGIVGLVGSNGAGKSTLLKVMLGLLKATSGEAKVLDLDVVTDAMAIRERVGYMPEHDCLPADVSATEFVVHMGRMSGLPTTAARERSADTLRHVGLYEERYRPMGGYSTGMKQRVKLAQALVHDPDLVLLDEPTNGLDPVGRDEMLELIRRIGTEFGISVLVTSHLLGELERVCDTVVVIDGGRLLRHSSTADMTRSTGVLVVEVDGDPGPLGQLLVRGGVEVHPDGRLLEVPLDGRDEERVLDLIRDGTVELDLGLVRLERARHHMAEMFTGPAAPAGGPDEQPG